jgi:hypothetical protein
MDMPASIENDAEVVAAEIDACAIDNVASVRDRDACEIVALGEVGRIWKKPANGNSDGKSDVYGKEWVD